MWLTLFSIPLFQLCLQTSYRTNVDPPLQNNPLHIVPSEPCQGQTFPFLSTVSSTVPGAITILANFFYTSSTLVFLIKVVPQATNTRQTISISLLFLIYVLFMYLKIVLASFFLFFFQPITLVSHTEFSAKIPG